MSSSTGSITHPSNGTPYRIRLGQTFLSDSSSSTFHQLQYSFKPSSVETRGRLRQNAPTDGCLELELESKKQGTEQSPSAATYFSGTYKNTPSSCILIFEPQKGFRLEKVSTATTIKVQRTRPPTWDEALPSAPPSSKSNISSNKAPVFENRDVPLKRPKIDKPATTTNHVKNVSHPPPTEYQHSRAFDVVSTDLLPSVVKSDDEASSDNEDLLKDIEMQMEEPEEEEQETIELVEAHEIPLEERLAMSANTPPQVVPTDTHKNASSSSSSSDSDSSSSSSSSDSEAPPQPDL